MRRLWTILPWLLAVAARAEETALYRAPLPPLPEDYWPRLESGEVIVMSKETEAEADRSYGDVVELALIEAPPETVFDVVDDCAHFHEFMPNLEYAQLKDGEGDERRVLARVWEFRLSLMIFSITYQIVTLSDRRHGVIEWTLFPNFSNEVRRTEGHWWFYPVDGGSATLVVYAARLESAFPIPQPLEEYAAEVAARDVLVNTRNRVLSGGTWRLGEPPPTGAP